MDAIAIDRLAESLVGFVVCGVCHEVGHLRYARITHVMPNEHHVWACVVDVRVLDDSGLSRALERASTLLDAEVMAIELI
jgi:hypothetical protein